MDRASEVANRAIQIQAFSAIPRMNFMPLFRQAFASLTPNWLRSVLTIVGISVGVGAFICVVAFGNAWEPHLECWRVLFRQPPSALSSAITLREELRNWIPLKAFDMNSSELSSPCWA
jgi:hypothetical protein